MSENSQAIVPSLASRLQINSVQPSMIREALSEGIADFFRRPLLSAFFGIVYTLLGLAILYAVAIYGQIWLIVPLAVGFPLLAPFLASGLYEMSRRYENGLDFTWGDIFAIIFRQQRREFGWMAFVTLFIFWIWIYQVRLWLTIFLQWHSFSSFDAFLTIVTTTQEGWGFLFVGTLVGAFLATVLFSVTVIAMPLLLHREIDFVSAMILSIRTVYENSFVMIGWGVVIAIMIFLAMIPAFLGLIFVLPVLGHATWRLYRKVISEKAAA